MDANLSRFADRRLIREPLRRPHRSLAATRASLYSVVVSQRNEGDGMASDTPGLEAVRALLTDSFERVRTAVASLTEDLTRELATYRPDDDANTVAWLLWHLARVQDDHVSELAGLEQVWTARGWVERFGLPFDPTATGYGHDRDEVAAVVAEASLLDGYQADVHRQTVDYVQSLPVGDLDKVIDRSWDPPVTVRVRLVSVIEDCLQHVGQAAYLRGVAERARSHRAGRGA
jgi:Protein of unknown function (DUF664)